MESNGLVYSRPDTHKDREDGIGRRVQAHVIELLRRLSGSTRVEKERWVNTSREDQRVRSC